MSSEEWLAANQRLLVAEFARIAAQVEGSDSFASAAMVEAARAAMPEKSAIDIVADAFGLTPFERDVLLLCAGAEMDGALAAHCNAEGVSFGFALGSLAEPHWSALTPVRPLRRWQLVEILEGHSLCTSRLRIDERVLHFLVGINYLDTRLRTLLRAHDLAVALGEQQSHIVESTVRALQAKSGEPLVVQLHGSDSASQREVARSIAARMGLALYRLAGSELPASALDAQALARLWTRESLLLGAAVCIEALDADPVRIKRFIREPGSLVFVMGAQPVALESAELRFQVDVPAVDEQKSLWKQALGDHARLLNGSLDVVASRFRVGTDVMARAAEALRQTPGDPISVESIVLQSCRDSIRQRMEGLAERIEPIATWDDLVLPESQLATLREIGAHVRRRRTVYEDWGFARNCARGLGISALFAGESGTGKTMAAEVLANELQVDLYRIDLASMVSKYIGETEKNLRKVFDAAEDGAAILLFDEADALFGKRSEVNDSHDRYANIEVSYLLQRMESYRGLAILTTNLKSALDTAFQRRLRFVVQFPFPDSRLREQIWRHVFPASTPTAGLDHSRLAQLNASGGSIRNIAMNAAFLAADSEKPICMAHLLKAARSEATKRERPYSDAETRGWA